MTDDTAPEMEDERDIELSSISAIFPEIALDPLNSFSASLELPVTPSIPLPVVFPEPSEGPNKVLNDRERRLEIHHLSHLPSIHLQINLPKGYPSSKPPLFSLSTTPQWLSTAVLERLQSEGIRLWEEFGHDQIVFAYIDHLQQSAENIFGVLNGNESLQVSQDLKIALLDFDINAKRTAFERETFTCGVCLDPKKGSACHRMIDCGHVFCRHCLQEFYNNAITEGDLASIKCLAPDCAKKRSKMGNSSRGKRRKPRTRISPSELLQIPIEREMVRRYVTLKHKAELESDKNTIYCPRKWCQGAARSQKHRKPSQLLNDTDSGGEDSEVESDSRRTKTSYNAWGELLSVCEDCSFAFCSRCCQGWHGEFTLCTPRINTGEITEEDKASLEYLKLHTTPCPTCAAPAQKTHGCNHMICFKCETHFCYLCSAWLEPANPYQHYNLVTTSCYMRLWELEGGDGDDVGIGFVGGVQVREGIVPQIEAIEVQPAAVRPVARNIVVDAPAEPPANLILPLAQPVAREGPRVLRIDQVAPRVPPAPQRANVPHPPQPRGPGHLQPNRRPAGNGYAERPAGARHVEVAALRRRLRADQQARHARPARNAAPPAARHAAAPPPRAAAQQAADRPVIPAEGMVAANRRWVENFVRLALADEEDLVEWDSDEEEDAGWQIPVR